MIITDNKMNKVTIESLAAGDTFLYTDNKHYAVLEAERKGGNVMCVRLEDFTVNKLSADHFVDKLEASLSFK